MISYSDGADIADAPQGNQPFAILGRFFGPSRIQLARRAGDGTKMPADQSQRLGFLELARDDEHDIIGLIKLLVKGLEVLDGHPFDIAPVANGRFAIIMPVVSGRLD